MPLATSSGKKISGWAEMDVHVPQPGDQKFATGRRRPGSPRGDLIFLRIAVMRAPAMATSRFLRGARAGGVDDGDVPDDQRLGERRLVTASQETERICRRHYRIFSNGGFEILDGGFADERFHFFAGAVIEEQAGQGRRPTWGRSRRRTCRHRRLSPDRWRRRHVFSSSDFQSRGLCFGLVGGDGDQLESAGAKFLLELDEIPASPRGRACTRWPRNRPVPPCLCARRPLGDSRAGRRAKA